MTSPQTTSLPLVSLVIPTIGRPQYILDTLNSAIQQDYENLEIIVSDNVSKISTKSLANSLDLKRVKFIERSERLTFSDHFNECLLDAHGEYLFFLSDDDLIEENYVSSLVALFIENKNIKVALGKQLIVDASFNSLSRPRFDKGAKVQCGTHDGLHYLKKTLSGSMPPPVATYISMFAKRDDMIRLGGWRKYPDGSNADNLLFIKLCLEGQVAFTESTLFYRVYNTSFGLSTPFEALLTACKEFETDVIQHCLLNKEKISILSSLLILLLIKIRNFLMVTNRLFRIYRKSLSAPSAFVLFCKAFSTLLRIPCKKDQDVR